MLVLKVSKYDPWPRDMTNPDSPQASDGKEVEQALPFAEFLESVPPNTPTQVTDMREWRSNGFTYVITEDIGLYCGTEACERVQFFGFLGTPRSVGTPSTLAFLAYRCRNCQRTIKTFALSLSFDDNKESKNGVALKFGENPAFGPVVPPRLVTLVGGDRDAFLKGRRAESLGLGIGAFAYYRRVVENQKDRMLGEIMRVAKRVGAPEETITILQSAQRETQFKTAVEMVKHAIPETLKIQGHNPLTLLHSALSEGLHAQSDEACLEAAGDIRVILQELAERVAAALKDDATLKASLTRLLNRK